MVAFLERSDKNAEFYQIVDFITTSSILYALTVCPIIYASYIEHFWATAKSKIVNDVKQIHAKVDGKTVVISESSVRSDLHFNDEDGIACLSNDEIFVNLALMGFFMRITPLFASMLVPQVVEGEGSRQPSKPQPASSTAPPSQITTIATQHQKTHKPRRAKRGRDTEIPQSSGPPKKVGDEVVYIEEHDRVVRAATTASSLEAEQESGSGPRRQDTTLEGANAQTRFETASKKSHDPPLLEGNTSGSGEDSMEHPVDLMDFVPPTPHDSPVLGGMKLFKISTSRRKGLDKENVSNQGRKSDKTKPMFNDSDFDVLDDAIENVKVGSIAEQITTAGDTLNTASINVSVAGPSHVSTAGPSNVSVAGPSISTAGDIFKDEMTTIADTLVAIRSARPRTTSLMIRNVEEEPRRATPVPILQSQDKGKGMMVELEPTPKNLRKAQIQMDEELVVAREATPQY
ncbi:hypothetical protein Tco_0038129, partial [Tanacetum coccineum]